MPVVRILNGPLQDKVFPIAKEKVTIGRMASETICLDEAGVSRQHAVIFRIGEMCFIRDLQSRNGTYVNEQQITEELLQAGDTITIGTTAMRFEDESSPAGEDVPFTSGEEGLSSAAIEYQLERQGTVSSGLKDTALKNLGTLYQLAKKISSIRSRPRLLEEVIRFTTEAVQADHGYIFIREKNGKISCKASAERRTVKRTPVSRSIVKRVLQTNRVILTADATTDERFRGNESVLQKKVKSVICVPLTSQQRIRGVIYLNADGSEKLFGKQETELACTIAIWTGMADDNLRAKEIQREEEQQIVQALVSAMESRLPGSQGHGLRVAYYARAIAREMELDEENQYLVYLGGLLHDVGKIMGPESDRETPYEEHVLLGERILWDIEHFAEVVLAVKYHHEKFNGQGFPEGLTGQAIPLSARIVGLANRFDHLRVAQQGASHSLLKDILLELMNKEGEDFDESVVTALLVAHRKGHLSLPPELA